MVKKCPNLQCSKSAGSESRFYIKKGYFKTKWNAQPVPRYQCSECRVYFSSHTFLKTFGQKKPYLNQEVFKWYSSTVTLRRMAINLKVNRKTIVRKFRFMASLARDAHETWLEKSKGKYSRIEFDEMETFEHTRLKPLSIVLAVTDSGFLLDCRVASMNCKGKRAALSRRKYGLRPDTRAKSIIEVLTSVERVAAKAAVLISDSKRSYLPQVKTTLPQATYLQTKRFFSRALFQKGQRKNKNDLMFNLNLMAATLRHDLSRLGRRVWVTTKKASRLQEHLDLYLAFINKYELPC